MTLLQAVLDTSAGQALYEVTAIPDIIIMNIEIVTHLLITIK